MLLLTQALLFLCSLGDALPATMMHCSEAAADLYRTDLDDILADITAFVSTLRLALVPQSDSEQAAAKCECRYPGCLRYRYCKLRSLDDQLLVSQYSRLHRE